MSVVMVLHVVDSRFIVWCAIIERRMAKSRISRHGSPLGTDKPVLCCKFIPAKYLPPCRHQRQPPTVHLRSSVRTLHDLRDRFAIRRARSKPRQPSGSSSNLKLPWNLGVGPITTWVEFSFDITIPTEYFNSVIQMFF